MTSSLADGPDSVIGPTWQGPYNTGQRAARELKYCAVVDDARASCHLVGNLIQVRRRCRCSARCVWCCAWVSWPSTTPTLWRRSSRTTTSTTTTIPLLTPMTSCRQCTSGHVPANMTASPTKPSTRPDSVRFWLLWLEHYLRFFWTSKGRGAASGERLNFCAKWLASTDAF